MSFTHSGREGAISRLDYNKYAIPYQKEVPFPPTFSVVRLIFSEMNQFKGQREDTPSS